MAESYTGPSDDVTVPPPAPPDAPAPDRLLAREVLAQLLPGYDADQILRALITERHSGGEAPSPPSRYNSDDELAQRELARARAQIALGETARSLQHAFNNPLTALLAEAQLLELDPLGDEQRAAVRRILELSRRLVGLSRRLGASDAPRPGI
ncbi:MAG: histidine kinase dimerization/phospho-acceptor domain-containing protein [bacterium]